MIFEVMFLISLLITVVIEILVLVLFIKYLFKDKKNSLWNIIIVGFMASALTLPYLWFILPNYINSIYYFYIGEFLVFFVESLIYYKFFNIKFKKALILSFIANLFSFVVGLLVF